MQNNMYATLDVLQYATAGASFQGAQGIYNSQNISSKNQG